MFHVCSQSDEINICKIFFTEAFEKSQEMLDSEIEPTNASFVLNSKFAHRCWRFE